MLEFFRNLNKKRRKHVEYLDAVESAEDALRLLDARNEREWGIASAHRTIDHQAARVSFVTLQGQVITARVHVVGSLAAGGGIWRWAWEMPALNPAVTQLAEKVKRYGEQRQYPRLTVTGFPVTVIEAWGLTALACSLGAGRGAFSEARAGGLLFFVFSDEALDVSARGGPVAIEAAGPAPVQ